MKLRVALKMSGDLGDPLISPQGSQISFGVAMGTLGLLVHHCIAAGMNRASS